MIYPSIEDLTENGKFNRYELVIAAAKCARNITDELTSRNEESENYQTKDVLERVLYKREMKDEKAVKQAINKIYNGEVVIKNGLRTRDKG